MAANNTEVYVSFLRKGLRVKKGETPPKDIDVYNAIRVEVGRRDIYGHRADIYSHRGGRESWHIGSNLQNITVLDDALCFLLQPGREKIYYELASHIIGAYVDREYRSLTPLTNLGRYQQSAVDLAWSCYSALSDKDKTGSGINQVLQAISRRDVSEFEKSTNASLPSGRLLLPAMIEDGLTHIVIKLVRKRRISQEIAVSKYGKTTALRLAQQLNQSGIVAAIQEFDADEVKQKNGKLNELLPSKRRPLLAMIEDGQEDLAIDLIRQGAELKPASEAVDPNWPEHENALHTAVRYGRRKVITYLISQTEMGQHLHEKNEKLLSAIFVAAETGHVEMLLSALPPSRRAELINSKLDNEMTSLHHAALKNSRQGCSELLRFGAEVDAQTTDGQTPLHIAVSNNAKEGYLALLEAGANPNARTPNNTTSLHIAVRNNNRHGCLALLQAEANINARTFPEGETPLHLAIGQDRMRLAWLLIHKGADVTIADEQGRSPLRLTNAKTILQKIDNLNYELLDQIQRKRDFLNQKDPVLFVEQISACDYLLRFIHANIQTPSSIIIAAFKASSVYKKILVMQQPFELQNIMQRTRQVLMSGDIQGFDAWLTSLIRPIYQQYLRTAHPVYPPLNEPGAPALPLVSALPEPELLHRPFNDCVKTFKDIRTENGASNKDLCAIYERDLLLEIFFLNLEQWYPSDRQIAQAKQSLHKLLHAGIDPCSINPESGMTVLHKVSSLREALSKEILHLLLASRAILLINHKDKVGDTPFLHAAKKGNIGVMQILLEHSADPCLVNYAGDTALHCAVYHGHLETSSFLLQQGFSLTGKNNNAETPLHVALSQKEYGIFQLLLLHDADPYEQPLPNGTFVWEVVDERIKQMFQTIRNDNAKVMHVLEELKERATNTNEETKGFNELLNILKEKPNRPYSANLSEFKTKNPKLYQAIMPPAQTLSFTSMFQPRVSSPLSGFATSGYRQHFINGEPPIAILTRDFSQRLLFWQQPLVIPTLSCSSAPTSSTSSNAAGPSCQG
jgi:ankyrin repeat protein